MLWDFLQKFWADYAENCHFFPNILITRLMTTSWPPYTKNAYHTIPHKKINIIQLHTSCVWRKGFSYNFHTFSKNNRKTIKPFLRLIENSWTDWWQKKIDIKIFLRKMLAIQFPYTTQKIWKIWLTFFLGQPISFSELCQIIKKTVIWLNVLRRNVCVFWR